MTPTASEITALFDGLFVSTENTCLVGGAPEPYYRPATADEPARIFFRDDYLRSALHEVAHWCVAGTARRQVADYGYWYSPDDRDLKAQQAFFAVEAQPQALEKHFCVALGIPFAPSIDNLSLVIPERELRAFSERLDHWYRHYAHHGLNGRAARFCAALAELRPRRAG